ncbi:MAG: hypothetical protein CVU31_17850 [Betaproteobacteria bacterium HGW-Betaproteobacteria-4]|jgi:hypothetical protein|nr:MAG: hypothetical protein CVU31_17850 [Betaproteobacteria bacterium HGW-Betaproteobacteria-4]
MTTKPKTRAAKTVRLAAATPIVGAPNTATPSKYIGETEKNLNQVLPPATSNDISLIVDDADDLFGRRSK